MALFQELVLFSVNINQSNTRVKSCWTPSFW